MIFGGTDQLYETNQTIQILKPLKFSVDGLTGEIVSEPILGATFILNIYDEDGIVFDGLANIPYVESPAGTYLAIIPGESIPEAEVQYTMVITETALYNNKVMYTRTRTVLVRTF